MTRRSSWVLAITLCMLALPLFGGEGFKVTVKRLGESAAPAEAEESAEPSDAKVEAPKKARAERSDAVAPKSAQSRSPKRAPRPGARRAIAGPKLQLRVRLDTNVELGRLVRLSDVVELKADAKGLWKQLKDVVVAGGKKRWVSRSDLERRIRGAGVPLDAVRIQGPAVCRVSNRGGGGR